MSFHCFSEFDIFFLSNCKLFYVLISIFNRRFNRKSYKICYADIKETISINYFISALKETVNRGD